MTGSNKILTVSYGTFSCTLEGFDDPFGTMRGIAEYFRDLAADDRYFGAEPPTPDVEMLQNIAQGQMRRRVEARIGEDGVSLRQMDSEPEAQKKQRVPDAVAVEESDAIDHGPLAPEDDYLLSDEPEDVLTVDPSLAPADTTPAETVAEKLRRIRAVVSRTHVLQPAEDASLFSDAPASEQESDAAGGVALRDRALSETIASINADLSEDDDIEANLDLTADESDQMDDDLADEKAVRNIIASSYLEDAVDDEVTDSGDRGTESVGDDVAAVAADTDLGKGDSAEPEYEDSRDEVTSFADDAPVADGESPDEATEVAHDAAQSDNGEPRASRNEFEVASDKRVTRPLAPIGDTNDDVKRLLAEADNKLNEDEGIRRRRVISQMRAAVAATKAERSIKGDPASKEEQDHEQQSIYRKVLSQVVIPLALDDAEKSPSANSSRPAPLVLVSSQRVDVTVETHSESAGPQRVERTNHSETPEASGFAQFAAQVGASELPDLLEAAAAYTAFVKGQPHFSRPEIMKRVARFDPAMNLSREAGLRSFGQLLRQGKIQKLQRGQFTISDDTRFKPSQRFAGE